MRLSKGTLVCGVESQLARAAANECNFRGMDVHGTAYKPRISTDQAEAGARYRPLPVSRANICRHLACFQMLNAAHAATAQQKTVRTKRNFVASSAATPITPTPTPHKSFWPEGSPLRLPLDMRGKTRTTGLRAETPTHCRSPGSLSIRLRGQAPVAERQTRCVQVAVLERVWEFNSPRAHFFT